ncbi:MAG: hypothetical protein R2862_06550 [Thermoanaerobaculia bacterium]
MESGERREIELLLRSAGEVEQQEFRRLGLAGSDLRPNRLRLEVARVGHVPDQLLEPSAGGAQGAGRFVALRRQHDEQVPTRGERTAPPRARSSSKYQVPAAASARPAPRTRFFPGFELPFRALGEHLEEPPFGLREVPSGGVVSSGSLPNRRSASVSVRPLAGSWA